MLGEIADCAETNVSRWNANFSVSDSHITNHTRTSIRTQTHALEHERAHRYSHT